MAEFFILFKHLYPSVTNRMGTGIYSNKFTGTCLYLLPVPISVYIFPFLPITCNHIHLMDTNGYKYIVLLFFYFYYY